MVVKGITGRRAAHPDADGVGEVIAVGEGVDGFSVGARAREGLSDAFTHACARSARVEAQMDDPPTTLYLVYVDLDVAAHPEPSPDLVALAPGLYLTESGRTRSQVYHAAASKVSAGQPFCSQIQGRSMLMRGIWRTFAA